MSELLGTPGEYEKIRQELHGVIFKDPMTQGGEENGWVTADEYLSGNVREKLRVAALARKPKDFRELIGILQEAGYEYKDENSLPCGEKATPDLLVSALLAKDIRLKNSAK